MKQMKYCTREEWQLLFSAKRGRINLQEIQQVLSENEKVR